MKRILIIVVFLASPTHPRRAEANIFGDVWNKAKSVGGAIVGAGRSAISAGGDALRWGIGATYGQAIAGATDPLLDGAANRLREVGDHLIDHAAQDLSNALTKGLTTLDDIANKRIEQLGTIMAKSIHDVDVMFDDKIAQVDQIISQMIAKESQILESSLDRVDQIADRSLTRLESIEVTALDRIDSTVQDQLPVAANRVVRNVEWALFVLLTVGAIVVFGGMKAIRAYQRENGQQRRKRLKSAFSETWRAGALVLAPALGLALIVQLSYVLYYKHEDTVQLRTLDEAARNMELNSDYAAAAVIRARIIRLTDGRENRYGYVRDQWIASFLATGKTNSLELWASLQKIKQDYASDFSVDLELRSADAYNRERKSRDRLQDSSEYEAQLSALAELSEAIYVLPQHVALGKLAMMSRIRMLIDQPGVSIDRRIRQGIFECSRVANRYPDYAPALVLRAQLKAMSGTVEALSPKVGARASKTSSEIAYRDDLVASIAQDLDSAAVNAPDLVRMVHFASFTLTPDEVKSISKIALDNDAAADKAAVTSALRAAEARFTNDAQAAFGATEIAKALSAREFLTAVRRDLGDEQLRREIHQLNDPPTGVDEIAKSETIASDAEKSGQLAVAEAWYQHAIDLAEKSVVAVKNQADDQTHLLLIRARRVSIGTAFVF